MRLNYGVDRYGMAEVFQLNFLNGMNCGETQTIKPEELACANPNIHNATIAKYTEQDETEALDENTMAGILLFLVIKVVVYPIHRLFWSLA